MSTIGIIGAMDIEVETLKKHMTIRRTVTRANMEFCEGVLSGHEAVVVKSGIGKVNAAVCTCILVGEFHVDARLVVEKGITPVINTGIAGSLRNEINIGDIVISTDLMYHDMDATIFGYKPGVVPQLGIESFEADARLCELAEKACKEVNPEIQVFHGRVVSGDQFVSSKEVKERIVLHRDGRRSHCPCSMAEQGSFCGVKSHFRQSRRQRIHGL